MKHIETKPAFDLTQPIQFLALGFGSGLAPKAPGTFGTLAAIPVFLLLTMLMPAPLPYALAVIVMGLAGIYICGKAADDVGVHDHPAIVWDEFVGFFITMFMVPVSWQSILVGFILFRIFDILKPWPISFIDKKMTGGLGIMFDDVLAGIFALAIMQLIF
jgi:phosphatidylglycerophosphatase A